MSNKWSDYFQPKDYSFIGYYEHCSKQTDFTFSFQKESYKLRADFDILMKHGSTEAKKVVSQPDKSFKVYALFLISVFLTLR